eukprot:63825-Chlamydomonas_euryale.AAC.1
MACRSTGSSSPVCWPAAVGMGRQVWAAGYRRVGGWRTPDRWVGGQEMDDRGRGNRGRSGGKPRG